MDDTTTLSLTVEEGAVGWINEREWHDSVLHNFSVVRSMPCDRVMMNINLNVSASQTESITIVFDDCWAFQAKINGGVVCLSDGEMIDSFHCAESGQLLDKVTRVWSENRVDLRGLAQLDVLLASTGSTVNVLFRRITIRSHGLVARHPETTGYPPKSLFDGDGRFPLQ